MLIFPFDNPRKSNLLLMLVNYIVSFICVNRFTDLLFYYSFCFELNTFCKEFTFRNLKF